MRSLTLAEIVELHLLVAKATGGASGIRDLAALESAIAGAEIDATVDEQEKIMLTLASGQMNRQTFTEWLNQHLKAAAGFEGL